MFEFFKKKEKVELTRKTYEDIRKELETLRDECLKRKSELEEKIGLEKDRIDKLNSKIAEIDSLIHSLESERDDLKEERSNAKKDIKRKKYSLKKVNQFMRNSIRLGRKLDKEFFDAGLSDKTDVSIYFVELETSEREVGESLQQLTPDVYSAAKTHLVGEMSKAKGEQQSIQSSIETAEQTLGLINGDLENNQQQLDSRHEQKSNEKELVSTSRGKIRANRKLFRQNERKLNRIVRLAHRLEKAYVNNAPVDLESFKVR